MGINMLRPCMALNMHLQVVVRYFHNTSSLEENVGDNEDLVNKKKKNTKEDKENKKKNTKEDKENMCSPEDLVNKKKKNTKEDKENKKKNTKEDLVNNNHTSETYNEETNNKEDTDSDSDSDTNTKQDNWINWKVNDLPLKDFKKKILSNFLKCFYSKMKKKVSNNNNENSNQYKNAVIDLLEDNKEVIHKNEFEKTKFLYSLKTKIENLTMEFDEESLDKTSYNILNKLIKQDQTNARDYLLPKLSEKDANLLQVFNQYTIEALIVHLLAQLFNNSEDNLIIRVATLIEQLDLIVRNQASFFKSRMKVNKEVSEEVPEEVQDFKKSKKKKKINDLFPIGIGLVEFLEERKLIEFTTDIKSQDKVVTQKDIQQARYERFILRLAQAYDGYQFYLPVFLDFRGRIYRCGLLHFHERDLVRSLIDTKVVDPHPGLIIATHDFKEPYPLCNEIDLLSIATMDLLNQYVYPSISGYCKFTITMTLKKSYGENLSFTRGSAIPLTYQDCTFIPINEIYSRIKDIFERNAEIYDGDVVIQLMIRVYMDGTKKDRPTFSFEDIYGPDDGGVRECVKMRRTQTKWK
ncbi:hypothetical protein VNO80_16364 [Phaseolus coccineus]|uniref:DNA-directed RNA polymerase n=1 Tax=Phaseolus coccineus TaxID=3886 RepID=A0AAN9MT56_PHACN